MKIGAFVVVAVVSAFFAPRLLLGGAGTEPAEITYANTAQEQPSGPITARAFRDNRGHFSFDTRMNGKSVKVLVDTGASAVAINQATATRIGLKGKGRGRVKVSTANGTIRATRHTIKEIRIGKIIVRNVDALVLPDRALSGTLLGMSFLKKLQKFEFNGRTLTLVQLG